MLSFLVRSVLVVLLVAGGLTVVGAVSPPVAAAQKIADSDGDGTDDSRDSCPTLPAADSVFLGCPSEDPDGDGFPSRPVPPVGLPGDFCGEIAGTQEFIGCPSTDPDGDGVDEDSCPQVVGPAPNGCVMLAPSEPESVRAGRMTLDRQAGLSLYGSPFGPEPAGLFSPQTLTVSLPKGISILDRGVKACSEALVRKLKRGTFRCTRVAAGRLATDTDTRAWHAYAGPTRGNKRLVWMRSKKDDGSLGAFGTGTITATTGAYSTKLVLRFGELDLTARGVEVEIFQLRERRRCPAGGWQFRLAVAAAEGADSVAWRESCGRGRD